MENEKVLALLEKYDQGLCTKEESAAVEAWYNARAAKHSAQPIDEDLETEMALIWENIQQNKTPVKTIRLNYRKMAATAAAILVVFTASLLFFMQRPQKEVLTTAVQKNVIKPGKHSATLTLANGQKIVLTDANTGEIAQQTGVTITKGANGRLIYTALSASKNSTNGGAEAPQFNTVQTPVGGEYQINLPDGTKVWLNASSSLKFPAHFTGNERKVILSGEGYFEVAKDKLKPFKVTTGEQEIQVYGTHFNVSAYPRDERTKTTLLEGSVKVNAPNQKALFLKPGEQAVLKKDKIELRVVDAQAAIAWKNGLFVFDNERIETIMRRVSRWYDVEVIYKGAVTNERLMGTISRYRDINDVLDLLALTNLVHFKIEGRRIIVMP